MLLVPPRLRDDAPGPVIDDGNNQAAGPAQAARRRAGAGWMCAGKGQHEEAWGAAPHLADLLKREEDELLQYVQHLRLCGASRCHRERRGSGASRVRRFHLLLLETRVPQPARRPRRAEAQRRAACHELGGFSRARAAPVWGPARRGGRPAEYPFGVNSPSVHRGGRPSWTRMLWGGAEGLAVRVCLGGEAFFPGGKVTA